MPSKKSKKKAGRKASAGTPDVPSASGSGAANTPNVPPASGPGNAGAQGASSAGEPSGTGASGASAVTRSGAADVSSASTASGSGSTGASGAPPTSESGGAVASATSTAGESGAPSQSSTNVPPSSYPVADKGHLVEKPFESKPTVKAFGTGQVSSSFSFSGAGEDVRRPSFDPNDYSVRQDMNAAQEAIDRSATTFEATNNALLRQKIEKDAETFRRLRGSYDEMAGQVRKLEQDLKAYQTELANLKSTFASTTGADAEKIRKLEADCDEYMAKIRKLEREAREHEEKIKNLESHSDNANAEITRANDEYDKMRAALRTAETEVTEKKDQVALLQEQLSNMTDECSDMRDDMHALRQDRDAKELALSDLRVDVKLMETEIARMQDMEAEHAGSDRKLRQLNAQIDGLQIELRGLTNEVEKLRREREYCEANHVDRAHAVASPAAPMAPGSRRPSKDLSSELSSIGEADEEGNLKSPDDVDEEEDERHLDPDRPTSRPHQHKGKHREGTKPVVPPTLDIDSPHIIADIPPSSTTAGTPTSPTNPTTTTPPSFPFFFFYLYLLLLLYTLYVLTTNLRERRIWRGANELTRRHVVSLRTGGTAGFGTGTGAYGTGGMGAYGMGSWLLGVVPVGWSTTEGPVWDWIAAGLGEVEGMLGGVGRGLLF